MYPPAEGAAAKSWVAAQHWLMLSFSCLICGILPENPPKTLAI